MKNQSEILHLIRTKISEHQIEIEGCVRDLGTLKKDSLESATKYLVLKDKLVFHKAVVMCLEDLRQEIEK